MIPKHSPDHRWHIASAGFCGPERRRSGDNGGEFLARAAVPADESHRATHSLQHVHESNARRIDADTGKAHLSLRRQRGERDHVRSRRRVGWNGDVECPQLMHLRDRNALVTSRDGHSEGCKHELGVIS